MSITIYQKNIHVIPEMRHLSGVWRVSTINSYHGFPKVFSIPTEAAGYMAARFFASSCSSAKPKSESLPSQPGGRVPAIFPWYCCFGFFFGTMVAKSSESFHRKDHFERIFAKDHRNQTSSCFMDPFLGGVVWWYVFGVSWDSLLKDKQYIIWRILVKMGIFPK